MATGLNYTPREVDEMTPTEIESFRVLGELEDEKDKLDKMGAKHHAETIGRVNQNAQLYQAKMEQQEREMLE